MGRFTKITYSKAFVTGPYLQDRPGFEYELDEGEEPVGALTMLKAMLESWHKASNPHLCELSPEFVNATAPIGPPPPLEINLQTERIEIAIDNANTPDRLKKVKEMFPVMNNKLIQQYNSKMEILKEEWDKIMNHNTKP